MQRLICFDHKELGNATTSWSTNLTEAQLLHICHIYIQASNWSPKEAEIKWFQRSGSTAIPRPVPGPPSFWSRTPKEAQSLCPINISIPDDWALSRQVLVRVSHIPPEHQSRSRSRKKSCTTARRLFTSTVLEAEDLNQRSSSESSAGKERKVKNGPKTGTLLFYVQHCSFMFFYTVGSSGVVYQIVYCQTLSLDPLPVWRTWGLRLTC